MSIGLLIMGVLCVPSDSAADGSADGCTASVKLESQYDSGSATTSVSCRSTVGGSSGQSSVSHDSSGTSQTSSCHDSSGAEVACWVDDYWWSSTFNLYCETAQLADDNVLWNLHRDSQGNPQGTFYMCRSFGKEATTDAPYWSETGPATPVKPGADPVTVVRSAVASLGLHPPTVGVGAYTYPGYEDWGLSWWVGAPMWLWVDSTDPLQWGTHTVTATQDGMTVTASVTATQVRFDPGDDTELVTCRTPGTPRPWNPDDPLSHHSPTGCEHTYLTTNQLGDKTSRFSVSATVTWTVDWTTTDGQAGTFTTDITSATTPAIHVGELSVVLTTPPH